MFSSLDRIPACDGRTDRQTDGRRTSRHVVRAMHTCRAVITVPTYTTKYHYIRSAWHVLFIAVISVSLAITIQIQIQIQIQTPYYSVVTCCFIQCLPILPVGLLV